jgi:hypothetical protein
MYVERFCPRGTICHGVETACFVIANTSEFIQIWHLLHSRLNTRVLPLICIESMRNVSSFCRITRCIVSRSCASSTRSSLQVCKNGFLSVRIRFLRMIYATFQTTLCKRLRSADTSVRDLASLLHQFSNRWCRSQAKVPLEQSSAIVVRRTLRWLQVCFERYCFNTTRNVSQMSPQMSSGVHS